MPLSAARTNAAALASAPAQSPLGRTALAGTLAQADQADWGGSGTWGLGGDTWGLGAAGEEVPVTPPVAEDGGTVPGVFGVRHALLPGVVHFDYSWDLGQVG